MKLGFRVIGCFARTACALLALAACASTPRPKPTPELTPATLFPMPAGSAWSYDVDTGEGGNVLAISRVSAVDAMRVTIQGGEGAAHYELRADGIFREERGGYLLKVPIRLDATWPSGGGTQARVRRTGVHVEVPAGSFDGCIEIEEQGSASGADVVTTYCPNVGPAEIVSSMQLALSGHPVSVVAKLRGFQIGAAH